MPAPSRDSARALLLSGAASLALAAILGVVAWWLISGGLSSGVDALHLLSWGSSHDSAKRNAETSSLRFLLCGGVLAGALAALLGIVGAISLAKATRLRRA